MSEGGKTSCIHRIRNCHCHDKQTLDKGVCGEAGLALFQTFTVIDKNLFLNPKFLLIACQCSF